MSENERALRPFIAYFCRSEKTGPTVLNEMVNDPVGKASGRFWQVCSKKGRVSNG